MATCVPWSEAPWMGVCVTASRSSACASSAREGTAARSGRGPRGALPAALLAPRRGRADLLRLPPSLPPHPLCGAASSRERPRRSRPSGLGRRQSGGLLQGAASRADSAARRCGWGLRAGSCGYPLQQLVAMSFEHLPQRAWWATGKVLDRVGNLTYVALADRSPVGGNLAGRRLGHAGCAKAFDERLVVNGYGLDRPAGYLAQQRRHIVLAERFRPGDVVGFVLVAFGGKDRGGRRGAVLARDVGDSPVPAVMDELASGDRLRTGRNLILSVEGVAQRTPREAALAQRPFGVPVTWGDDGRVLPNRVEVGRVGYVTHTCLPGRFDGGAVLGRATAKVVGADQKQLLSACERLGERLRPIEVG